MHKNKATIGPLDHVCLPHKYTTNRKGYGLVFPHQTSMNIQLVEDLDT